jgi:hypothetical protein
MGLLVLVVVVVCAVWAVRVAGWSPPIWNGVRSEGTIVAYRDTGMAESSGAGSLGSTIYDLQLQVMPVRGGAPVVAHVRAQLDLMMAPDVGKRVPIIISPTNPKRVKVDHSRLDMPLDKSWHTANGSVPDATPTGTAPGLDFAFDANMNPATASLDNVVSGVTTGTQKIIHNSAAEILASGARGTAVITTCQPLGKTVRQMNPHATAHLDDPEWLFTVKVTVPGNGTWPAVMGHYVPQAKVGVVGPGVKLAVAVNMADKMNEVAIDWDQSPLP